MVLDSAVLDTLYAAGKRFEQTRPDQFHLTDDELKALHAVDDVVESEIRSVLDAAESFDPSKVSNYTTTNTRIGMYDGTTIHLLSEILVPTDVVSQAPLAALAGDYMGLERGQHGLLEFKRGSTPVDIITFDTLAPFSVAQGQAYQDIEYLVEAYLNTYVMRGFGLEKLKR